jgi:hypothetical protein
VLRLRFEVDYASRMDGRPDAPGEDAAASLEEKQAQLAEAQAAVEVSLVVAWLLLHGVDAAM